MRRLFALGRILAKSHTPAMICAWCVPQRPMTLRDRVRAILGAPISHGLCPKCAALMEDLRAREDS